MLYWTTVRLLAVSLLCVAASQARSHHRNNSAEGSFDYYLLALSYAPDFCDQPGGNKDSRECGSGRHIGFVVHGLWPQGETSRGPESCGPASPVSQDVIRIMLNYYPSESLIQHEWSMHGTCSGLGAADYFAFVRKARDLVKIPSDLQTPSRQVQIAPQELQNKFAAVNPNFPAGAFRESCYRNAELQEVRVCFDKNLNARACGISAGTCASEVSVLLPVR